MTNDSSSEQGVPAPTAPQPDVDALLHELRTSPPALHGWGGGDPGCWTLTLDALSWLRSAVRPGMRTLETGCGSSTILFAALGAKHTAVSPFAVEHERIVAFCKDRDVPLDDVTFIAGSSLDELPGLTGEGPLDLVLVDGDHAFPAPIVDWWYTQSRLSRGGLVIVDDTHLRACRVLRDFLAADAPRWKLVHQFAQTAVFEKLVDDATEGVWWKTQPWGQRMILTPKERVNRLRRQIEHRLGQRSKKP